MATRLYLRNAAGFAPPVSPAFSAAWTNTASADRRLFGVATDGTDTVTTTAAIGWTAGQVCLRRQFVSPPLRAGQTISGTVSAQIAVSELAADDNVTSRLGVHVVSADGGTVRAVLLAVGHYGTGTEYDTINENREFANADAIASYTAQAGDRIVVEVGHADATGTTPNANARFGSAAATDLPQDETTQIGARNPWVQFSADFDFIDGSGIDDVAERGPDTLFFGYSATAGSALATDLSGNDDDWTHDNFWIYRQNHSAAALQSAFTIDFACLVDNNDTGYLFENNLDAAPNNAIVVDGAGDIDFYVGGTLEASIDIPGVSATSSLLIGSWSAEANPLTTGSTDVLRHDVRLYNADTGAWDGASFTTGVLTGFDGSADTVFGARQTDGTDAFTGTLRMVRLSSHWHSPKELERCFLDVSAAPTPYGVTRVAWPLIQHTDAAWADDGYFAGPPHIWAAKSTHRNDLRLWGPLVNEVYTRNASTSDETWTTLDTPSGTYDLHLTTLRRRPVPPGCDRVRVRFWLENNAGSGRLNVRSFLSDTPGWLVSPSPSPAQITYEAQTQSNILFGTSGWYTVSHEVVPRDADGYVYHFLGTNDTAGSSDFTIHSVSVEPVLYSGNEG